MIITMSEANEYDLIIIGGGPAGLSAGLYGARGNLKTLLLEQGIIGGQLQITDDVENYPGMDHMTGPQISDEMEKQTRRFGCDVKTNEEVVEVDLKAQPKIIKTKKGDEYKAKTVIIATGSQYRRLGIPGEEKYTGKGVSYCAVCDGAFFKDKHVVVVGGGSSAVEEGNFLTKFASKVTLVHRRDELRAERILQNRFKANAKTDIIWDTVATEVKGDILGMTSVNLKNIKTNEEQDFKADGLFIYIGLDPNVEFLKDQIDLDGAGKIVANEKMETNLPGVFVSGDVRDTPLKQAVTAASDGSIAATMAIAYVEALEDQELQAA